MDQIAEQLTQELLRNLPEKGAPYTLDELLENGIPYIVVDTIRKKVVSKIDLEYSSPESEWINFNEQEIQRSWQKFVDLSRKHPQISAKHISAIIGEAVEQCVYLALKPRQATIDILFDSKESIDIETARERSDSIVVNSHLAMALVRYMEKKEKEEISKEQAFTLIQKIDQKLVEHYHPLKWAQVLKPIYELTGQNVSTDLIKIFFEDKEKPVYARKFDLMEKELNESELIEALSSADLLNLPDEAGQPELFMDQEEQTITDEEVIDREPETEENETEPEEEEIVIESEEYETEPEDEEIVTEDEEKESRPDHEKILVEESADFQESEKEPDIDNEPDLELDTIDEEIDIDKESSDEIDAEESNEADKDQNDNIVDLFSKNSDELFDENEDEHKLTIVERDDDIEDAEEDNITLLSKFIFDEEEGESEKAKTSEEADTTSEPEKEPSSIYDEMNLVKDDLIEIDRSRDEREKSEQLEETTREIPEEEDLSFQIDDQERSESESENEYDLEDLNDQKDLAIETDETDENDAIDESDESDESDETDESEEDQPMWRSFLERDELDTESGYEFENEDELDYEPENDIQEFDDDGFDEEPIYDLTTEEVEPEEKIEKISAWLDDDKIRFVEEIFNGSEMAYEQTLLEITDFDNWKSASMFLEKEVFSRNKIDVYEEAAVDFTDRLHSFFIENNSK